MLDTSVTLDPELQVIIDKLRNASKEVEPLLSQAVRSSALDVARNAKEICPVATGALARSIKPTFFARGLSALIGSWLPYAAKWEYSVVEHPVGMTLGGYIRHKITRGPNKGRLSPPMNTNPKATWGYLRKSLDAVAPFFIRRIEDIAGAFTEEIG